MNSAMEVIGVYCIKDTDLTIDLCEHLNIWTGMAELSNCTNVPMGYLHTRGQQIKVLAQLYRKCDKERYIIPFNAKGEEKDEKYQGAVVIDADQKGDHEDVATLDFSSLYPSIIITNNICYSTYLPPGDPTSDSQCNICEWEDHVGCVHDKTKRKTKKKANEIMCRKNRHRFLKVIYHPDGTTENEGLLPRMLKDLLKNRKIAKKEMEKRELQIKMNEGKADRDDMEVVKAFGMNVIKKDSLSEHDLFILKSEYSVLNAQQLAL